MAKEWKCARCATKNLESTLTCGACRMIRGAVVVPGSPVPRMATAEPILAPNVGGWAAPSRRSRVPWPIPVGAVFLVALLIGGTVSARFDAAPTQGSVPSNAPASAPVASAPVASAPFDIVDLRIGDCFDVQEPGIEAFAGLAPRSCTEAHRYEVFWTGAMPAGPFPSAEAFEAFHDAHCPDAFSAYVGEPLTQTRLATFWMVPNQEGWEAGYRSIQCSVCDPANPRLTYSLKGSGPSGNSAIPV